MKFSLIQNCIGLMQTNGDTITNLVSKMKIEEINKSIDEILLKPTKSFIYHYPRRKKKVYSTIHSIDLDNK